MSEISPTAEQHQGITTSIATCEQEQIHIPGSVQTFGSIIAFDNNHVITRASLNVDKFVGVDANELIGRSLGVILEPADFERVQRVTTKTQQTLIRLRLINSREIYAIARYLGDETYFDLLEQTSEVDSMTAVRQFVAAISSANTQLECAQRIAEQVRKITGFDRVKIYKFDSNWNGEVIAESRREDVPSYLGLHFPESDIPKQARELYIRNRVRVIANVDEPQSPIIQKEGLKPLDLSFSFVRSVSAIHLQYLQNMEVQASMSISIFQKGKFWGLIACHHHSPKTFDWEEESLFQTISDLSSGRISTLRGTEDAVEKKRTFDVLHQFITDNTRLDANTLMESNGALEALVKASGLAVCFDGKVYKKNAAPDEPTLLTLIEWLERGAETVFVCDDLPSRFGQTIGNYACGLLAAKVPNADRSWILWFRMEHVQEVHWAGDPYKPTDAHQFGQRLFPRTSFAIWKETQRGHSAPWAEAEIVSASEIATIAGNLLKPA